MLVVALISFVAGIGVLQQAAALPAPAVCAVAGAVGGSLAIVACAIASGTSAAGSAARAAWRCRHVVALVAGGLLGLAHAALLAHVRLSDELAFADEGRDIRIVGTIASLPAEIPRATRFAFDVERVETPGVHVPARIALAWYAPGTVVRPAERWRFTVRLRRPHGLLNPGGFDLEAWMFERNLRAGGYVRTPGREAIDDAPRRLAVFAGSFGGAIDRARDRLRDALRARLEDRRYAGVLIALAIGDQRAITDDDWQLFNRTGIAHLVSISGLHVTMIAGLAAGLASLAWRRSRRLLSRASAQAAAAVAAVAAAFFYCLLAGWGVPAQRTFFMVAIVCAALLVRSRPRAATTLSFAAALVCALDPWAVVAPGFWLSFGAVAAILYVVQGRARVPAPHGRYVRWRQAVRDAALVQVAVTIALVPLTVALFGQVSLVSPAANAVAIPVVSLLVTPLSLAAAGLVWLPEPFASFAVPLLAVAHALFAALADALRVVGAWPWSSVPLPAPAGWTLPVAAAGVAWLLAPRGWPLRWIGAVGLLPLFVLPGERPRIDELWVTALDVGQGMAVLIETGPHALLYDTGPRHGGTAAGSADAGARVIVPYLRRRGIGALDWLVVSHLDVDHSGGAASVLRETAVRRVLTSVPPWHAVLSGAGDVVRCDAGQGFTLGRARIDVLHPRAADHAAARRADNAMSCVVRVELGAARVLLTGDLPAREEAALLARTADVHATLVSAPHHGSRHSSSPRFVAAVAPRWVLVQAGYRNRFGHPDAAVVARWQQQGARVLRSDAAGAVQWRFGAAGGASVAGWRATRARYWHNRPPGLEAPAVSPAEMRAEPEAGPMAEPQAEPVAEPLTEPRTQPWPDPVGAPRDSDGEPARAPAPADAATGIEVATPPAADEFEPF